MHPIWYDYIKRNVDLYFISGLAGIWPPWFETKPRWFRVTWHIYHNLTDLILYLITITNFIGAVLLTDIFDVFASLPPLIHGIQMSGRLIILQSRKKMTEAYINELNELLLEDTKSPIEKSRTFREIHAADFKMNERLTSLEFFSLIMSNVVFFIPECLKSFITPDKAHVIIVSWYPYDASIALYKQLTNFAHTFSWLLINFKMASFDTLFQSLMILHTSQFRQLRYLFGKILPEEKAKLVPFSDEENRVIDEKLRWWIQQHQRSLSATKKLEEIFSPLLFFSYIECLFNMCLCAFLTTVESQWTPLQRFSAVCVVGTVFLQMFVMCRLGDYLEESSALVPELGHNVTIFCSNHKVQKSMVMILNRVYISVRFSAVRLFFLNSKYYGALVQGVFSYYMALRQLQSRD